MTDTATAVRKVGPGPVVLREAHVVRTARVTPRMMRVTLGGDGLQGFTSAAPDDHVVLFFLADGQEVPESAEPGRRPVWAERPPTRDYTPRAFDAAATELAIDFVLHGAGVASSWAEAATPGTRIALTDPRTSYVAEGFADYLLVGDETALPAIARRIEELPAGSTAQVFVEVTDALDEQNWTTAAEVTAHWLHRGDDAPGTGSALLDALRDADLPAVTRYTCVAGETDVVRRLRHHLLAERGLEPAHSRFSGYWKHAT